MSHKTVTTHYGKVKGTTENGVHIWKGIPYAKPPIGQLRFKAPEPPDVWEDVLDATAYGPICPRPPDLLSLSYGSFPSSLRIACMSMYLRLTLRVKTCLSWCGFTAALFISGQAVSHYMMGQDLRHRRSHCRYTELSARAIWIFTFVFV